MPDQEEIENQQRLLKTYRRTLAHNLVQQAQFGAGFVPSHIMHGINESRQAIRDIKITLRGWNEQVEDLLGDEEPASMHDTPTATAAKVGAGLEALIELMQASEARSAVAVYQVSFKAICGQIEMLGGYKMLHDLLQQLELRQAILARCCKGLPKDQAAWGDVETNEPDLYAKIDELLEFADQVSFASETALWTPKLARSQSEIRAALENYEADRLKAALGRVQEVIDRQLSCTNTRLVSVAEALHLEMLVQALRQICDQLVQAGPGGVAASRLDDFHPGVEALAGLNQRLKRAVALHTKFQEFDNDLRRVERVLEYDPDELVDSWQDLDRMMRALCGGVEAQWAARLSTLGDELALTVTVANPLRVRRAFSRYRSHASVCFNRVDHDLRDLCAVLQRVGSPLDRVLRMVQ